MNLRHQELIDAMTLDEKASLLSGANYWNTKPIKRLGIPSIMMTDGPHGLRKQAGKADHLGLNKSVPATCFPTASALANSWDASLLGRIGDALGAEAAANGVAALMGPGLNIIRDPLAGRAFEYYSEDPYITGQLAAALAKGVQRHGVAATPKHFAVNSQEHMRMSIDEVVDERTLHEIYLEGFRRVVQEAKPRLLMTAYNRVNGCYANEHGHLLVDILRDQWGYKGALVTDWGGNNDRVAGLRLGSTLEMPSSNGITDKEIAKAVKAGTLKESIVDGQVDQLLQLVFESTEALKHVKPVNYAEHHKLAIEAAEQSIVLLKNEDSLLPLKDDVSIALIGDFADTPRYQGAGSSLVNPTQLVSLREALAETPLKVIGYEPGFRRIGGKSTRKLHKAVALSTNADVVIACIGLDEAKEAEGIDRQAMAIPENQLVLLEKLIALNKKIIVVVAAGGPVELPFADKVAAIIQGSLSGQAVGTALANCITGLRNPSGKLALSYPLEYEDAPTVRYFPGKERTAEHREGLYVGYRYYETADVPVRYPFGYGLSYTTFAYANIEAARQSVSFSITNTGKVAGGEIAQVYIKPPKSAVFRPIRELKGFAKVFLEPGETKRVTISFDDHAFAYYSPEKSSWQTAAGTYDIEVGASIKDIRLTQALEVGGVTPKPEVDARDVPSYLSGKVADVPDDEFEALLGRPIPPALWDRGAKLCYEDTVAQLQYGNLRGRAFYGILKCVRRVFFALHKPYIANNVVFVMNLPFSRIPGFSGNKLSKKMVIWLFGLKG